MVKLTKTIKLFKIIFSGVLLVTIVWLSWDTKRRCHYYMRIEGPQPAKTPTEFDAIMNSFLTPDTGSTGSTGSPITADTWQGDCPYPWYIPEAMQKQSWFQPYLRRLQKVNLSKATYPRARVRACARWWSATPQLLYDDNPQENQTYLSEKYLKEWRPKPKPPIGYERPKCRGFGRRFVWPTACAMSHAVLWKALDELGIIYFPRAGTDLGVARGSAYLSTDGDIDIHVDMPPKLLLRTLSTVIKPAPYFKEVFYKEDYNETEVHWHIKGCPVVHMVFNDWMEDELSGSQASERAQHTDLCECLLNSVPLACHKETIYRTWLMYGPSWFVPLHAKALDVPHRGRNYNIAGKLRSMLSKDGVIHERSVRDLDRSIEYEPFEMEMILAQLNDLHALIECQIDEKCGSKLMWLPTVYDSKAQSFHQMQCGILVLFVMSYFMFT